MFPSGPFHTQGGDCPLALQIDRRGTGYVHEEVRAPTGVVSVSGAYLSASLGTVGHVYRTLYRKAEC